MWFCGGKKKTSGKVGNHMFWEAHLYVFFGEIPILVFQPFFWLSCFVFWYWAEWFIYIILEINVLSVASFVNTVSNPEGCLFASFMVSFAMQKLLSLIRSDLIIFVFRSITLGGGSKIFPWFMSECSAYGFP